MNFELDKKFQDLIAKGSFLQITQATQNLEPLTTFRLGTNPVRALTRISSGEDILVFKNDSDGLLYAIAGRREEARTINQRTVLSRHTKPKKKVRLPKPGLTYAMTIWLRHGDVISWYLVKNTGESTLLFQQNRFTFTNEPQCIHSIFERVAIFDGATVLPTPPATVDWQDGLLNYEGDETGTLTTVETAGTPGTWTPTQQGKQARLSFVSNRPVQITRNATAEAFSFTNRGGNAASTEGGFGFYTPLSATSGEFSNTALGELPFNGNPPSVSRTGTFTAFGYGNQTYVYLIAGDEPFMSSPSTLTGSATVSMTTAFSTLPGHNNAMGAIVTRAEDKLLILAGLNASPLGTAIRQETLPGFIGMESLPGAVAYSPQTLGLSKYDDGLTLQESRSYSFNLEMEDYDPGFAYNYSFSGTPEYMLNGKTISQPLEFEDDVDYSSSRLSGIPLNFMFNGGVGNFILSAANASNQSQLKGWDEPQQIVLTEGLSGLYISPNTQEFIQYGKKYSVKFSRLQNSETLELFQSADQLGLYSSVLFDKLK